MNNVLPEYDLPVNQDNRQNQLRNIVNADVLSSGRLKRRSGATKLVAAQTHSLYSDGTRAFGVFDDVLCEVLPNMTRIAIATMGSENRVSYVPIGPMTFYSNGAVKGRIMNGQAYHWGIEPPQSPPALTPTAGSLPAGTYMAIATFVDQFGEESGCYNSTVAALSAAGGFTVTLPQPTEAAVVAVRLYFSMTNDSVMYAIGDYAVGVTTVPITVMPQFGMALETQFMEPPPASDILEELYGRIYGVMGNFVWHTQPLRYGLYKPSTDFIQFPAPVVLLAAVSGGLYVVADKTYWLAGDSPDEFTIDSVLQYTAAKGSLSKLPRSEDVVWFSSAGLVKASPGGKIAMVQEPNVRTAPSESGASLYIEDKGIKKIVAAVSGDPFATSLSSTDYMDAEIERARR